MSQPNLSRSLQNLREQFGDPLFVRSSKGMAPTPKALSLAPQIREAIAKIQAVYSPSEFQPEKATGVFSIAATDYMEMMIAPSLCHVTSKTAAGLTVSFRPSLARIPIRAMETGEIDLTIAIQRGDWQNEASDSVRRQHLMTDPYLCVVRKNHPILNGKKDLSRFLDFGFILVSPHGDLWASFDELLSKKNLKRRVILAVPNALSAITAVEQSDSILVISRYFAEAVTKYIPVVMLPSPIPLKPIQLYQAWHERSHTDPLHQWIRGLVVKIMARPES